MIWRMLNILCGRDDAVKAGCGEGVILSVGGGTSPGMPRARIRDMLAALNELNARKPTP
jgi:hypothetical protein